MAYFSVDIYTPNKILRKDLPAESILLPTVRGQINILREHTHLIAKLEPGIGTFIDEQSRKTQVILTVGICKVLNNKITILTQVGENLEDINIERAERALNKAQEILSNGETLNEDKRLKYERKLQRAKIRLSLAKSFR
jgi:F-type H+-transporting ATPase subunit epsilon